MAQKKIAKKPAAKPNAVSAVRGGGGSGAGTGAKTRQLTRRVSRGKKAQLLRGLKDILPQEHGYWEYVQDSVAQTARAYGFSRIELPLVEDASLFTRALGETAESIEQGLAIFETETDEIVALRPEFRPGIARAYIEHGMLNLPRPVKLFTSGAVFLYDDLDAGRFVQPHQINWEIFGSEQPALDAECISMVSHLCQDMGLQVTTQLNSVGCKDCRQTYSGVLKEYLKDRRKNLCATCREKLGKNVMHVLNCKEEACRAITAEAPQTVDHLCDPCREHLMTVLEYLDEGDVLYRLEPRLLLNTEYYSRTVFQFVLQSEAEQATPAVLGYGGRYDELVERLGGSQPTPAVGVMLSVERMIIALKEANAPVTPASEPDVFFAHIGETARKRALQLFEELRAEGIAVASNISRNRLSDQLALAGKSQAKITLILGQKEMIDHTIIVRDMADGAQETMIQEKLIDTLKKRISANKADVKKGSAAKK